MSVPSSYDAIASIYDEDMGRNTDTRDVEFYVTRTGDRDGSVLELGCGTGRVTLPLVRAGRTVTGIDSSQPMLEKLREKAQATLSPEERNRLGWTRARMEDFSFETPFSYVICPYSAFTYLVDPADRAQALANVRRHLARGGEFLLDVFVPDPGLREMPDDHVYTDYDRVLGDGSRLTRTKTIRQDRAARVNVIRRTYSRFDGDGTLLEQFTTQDRIRTYEPPELRAVLEDAGFVIRSFAPDFGDAIEGKAPRMAAFVCSVR